GAELPDLRCLVGRWIAVLIDEDDEEVGTLSVREHGTLRGLWDTSGQPPDYATAPSVPCAAAKPGNRIRGGAPHFRSALMSRGNFGDVSANEGSGRRARRRGGAGAGTAFPGWEGLRAAGRRRLRGRGWCRYPAAPRPERRDHPRSRLREHRGV